VTFPKLEADLRTGEELMPLIIDLTPAEEAQLTAAASEQGISVQELARRILAANLPPLLKQDETDSALALLAQWIEEAERMTPGEKAEAERDLQEFKQNIDAERKRAGARPVYGDL
jgi:hypothetical protein